MTPLEIANLRLKCAEPFILSGSKVSLSDDTIFTQAEKLFQFVTAGLGDIYHGQASKAPDKSNQPPRRS